jgi:hypothetical protein
MSWGSPDHDHADLSRSIDEARYDLDRQISDLRDELYRVRSDLADYIRTEVEGLRERMSEADV